MSVLDSATLSPPTPRRPFYRLCLLNTGWVAALIVTSQMGDLYRATPLVAALLIAKMGCELLFSFFLLATLLKCADYATTLRTSERSSSAEGLDGPFGTPPPLAIVYLCCGDLDENALVSLARVTTGGEVAMFLHDDGNQGTPSSPVIDAARRAQQVTGTEISLFSRPIRSGGKPGAVNYVLDRIPSRFQVVLLADSDSYALSCEGLPATMARLNDPRIAAIQFRNTGVESRSDGPVARALVQALDVFDVFASHQARHGFMPFLGHNGLLRRSTLDEVGGLTPGMLSDDIDLSVRLALRGYKVEYAGDVVFGETVPPVYKAFRARARKWAVGCTQVLRRHLGPMLASRELSWRQKFGFVEFSGFYVLQVALIPYLLLAYVVLPIAAPSNDMQVLPAFLAGSFVSLAVTAPALLRGPRGGGRISFAWRLALAYGSLALATTHGVIEGALRGGTEWVPTARAGSGAPLPRTAVLEIGLGLALFAVPLVFRPALLAMPSTYLFASVYLSVPLLAMAYRPREAAKPPRARSRTLGRVVAGAVVLLALGLGFAVARGAGQSGPTTGRAVAIRDGTLVVDGKPFLVKGIHYSPYPPGTGPRNGGWPGSEVTERDFPLLGELGVNTLLVYEAPPSVLDRAQKSGLMVIYAFFVNWQTIDDDAAFATIEARIAETVRRQSGHPALLYYVIGNEVPDWLVDRLGHGAIESRIEALARTIRQNDPRALVSHANWPPTKDLNAPSLDIVSFNVYPAWPHEVAVKGYGAYIRDVLLPRAGHRPLVITEFGQNTLEASQERQAEILRDCWGAIRAQTQGGVVFSFVDEWWKNYDNPVSGGDHWKRAYAPDDQLTRDLDPEEYYGILSADREPKPAFAEVQRFFRDDRWTENGSKLLLARGAFVGFLALVLAYTVSVFWPRNVGGNV